MKQQTIKFTIGQDGSVKEEVITSTSGECVEITKSIEEKLGSLETRQFKPEFYQVQKNVTLQHDKNVNKT
tara:strand:+ start:1278 stop:1487 length:210 start_codon:yes stop_codon:yes gene_type:complete